MVCLRDLICQTAAPTIAEHAASIAAIAAYGEIRSRMKAKPHSAKSAILLFLPTIGPTARTGIPVRVSQSAQSMPPAFITMGISASHGMEWWSRNLSRPVHVLNAAQTLKTESLSRRWRGRRWNSAVTCTICNGGNANIQMKKHP